MSTNDIKNEDNLRLLFPQWQGGNNPPYFFGSQLLAWLAPAAQGKEITVPVVEPQRGQSLTNEDGIMGRSQVVKQLLSARDIVQEHQPRTITVLGGDCLVSLAPFTYLVEKYGQQLGVLWIDSHPDIMDETQFAHSHAHVLGVLLGHGDKQLGQVVKTPLAAKNVMIAGIHTPLPIEQEFLDAHNIATCSPQEVKDGGQKVLDWIQENDIKYLAIHFDLDVLDPLYFRSVLFARPGREEHDFGDAAEGRINMKHAVALINAAASQATPVGITIAEHLPWDSLNLKNMLASLPLL